MSLMLKVAIDKLKLGLEIALKVNLAFKSVFLKGFPVVLKHFHFILRGSTRFVYVSENVRSGIMRLS